MSASIEFETHSEADARRLAEALQHHADGLAGFDGSWRVGVNLSDDPNRIVAEVVPIALACFADRRIGGFTLLVDGRPYPVGE